MIRNIKPEDAYEIREICFVAMGYEADIELVERQIKKLLLDGTHHIIAVYEDEMTKKAVGFVHAERYDCLYNDVGLNILGLAVNPEFQRKGIGIKLMQFVEDYAVYNNISFIRLNSGSHRTDAHRFYEKLGFFCDKSQKRFIKKL